MILMALWEIMKRVMSTNLCAAEVGPVRDVLAGGLLGGDVVSPLRPGLPVAGTLPSRSSVVGTLLRRSSIGKSLRKGRRGLL
jgi:hypothetical protein